LGKIILDVVKVKIKKGIIGIILIAIAVIFFSSLLGRGYTLLYFNAESDLPDAMVIQRQPKNATGPQIHIVDLNRTYKVVFTVASIEKKKSRYRYEIRSQFHNESGILTIPPKGNMTFLIAFTPSESDKWVLNSTSDEERRDTIDITKNSWIAERKDFDVIVRREGLPAIVQERYDLPVSSELKHFGRIYHINITLDELREKPYTKSDEWESESVFEKVKTSESVSLSIKDEKLILHVTSKAEQYISEERPFVVTLIRDIDIGDVVVDEESDVETIQRIKFWYKIR